MTAAPSFRSAPSFLPSGPIPAGTLLPTGSAAPFHKAPPPAARIPRVLAIAGSDPSGGAGIQADLKSIAAHGGYGMAAISVLTAQNTRGVSAVHIPPADFLTSQLEALSADISIDAVKIGMLGDAAVIDAVRNWLAAARPAVVVLDPVMVSTSGDRLLQESAEAALHTLLPYADLITPNLAELAVLLRETVAADWDGALDQGKRLAALTGTTVLVKGGHLDGSGHGGAGCPDALVNTAGLLGRDLIEVPGERVSTRNSHGTGCSLSSAIATVQARIIGHTGAGDWETALREVKPWLREALRTSDRLDVGTGSGPVHHFHHLQQQARDHSGAGPVPAEGDFVAALRDTATADLAAIHGLDFIRGLADGSLPEREFTYYLSQDALYLNGYSRVLARAAAIAPTEAEQLFWLRSAQNCLEVESGLHRSWLGARSGPASPGPAAPGPVTRSYLDHLLATSAAGSYGVLVAAVLPCFWLYAEVGEALHRQFLATGAPAAHPYAEWLRTYADPEFAAATRQAIDYTDAAARAGSPAERDAMALAFRQSARYEVDFFDAPRLHG